MDCKVESRERRAGSAPSRVMSSRRGTRQDTEIDEGEKSRGRQTYLGLRVWWVEVGEKEGGGEREREQEVLESGLSPVLTLLSSDHLQRKPPLGT